jgi:uncharacterized protein (DUF2384 family)
MKKTIKPYSENSEEKSMIVNASLAVYLPANFIKSNVIDHITENSKDLFIKILNKTGLTIKILAENIFEITPKTFIKYKNNNVKIPSRIAELAIELDTLYNLGITLFGTSKAFNLWLDKDNMFFKNRKPVSFLNTSTGIHLVYEELNRIAFGATA